MKKVSLLISTLNIHGKQVASAADRARASPHSSNSSISLSLSVSVLKIFEIFKFE